MMIEQLRDDLAADGKKIPFELIGKLAWLATGREEPFDESTMRRYGRNVTPTGPAAKYWRRHFHLMIELGRLVPGAEQSQRFREAMHAFLQPPRHH
jgi:hypothetical protein